jgi:hypothetical protein
METAAHRAACGCMTRYPHSVLVLLPVSDGLQGELTGAGRHGVALLEIGKQPLVRQVERVQVSQS